MHGKAHGRGVHGVQRAHGQGLPFEDLELLFGEQKAGGRADLDDVRVAAVQIDGGKVQAGKAFVCRKGDKAVDGGKHGVRGHSRLVKALQQGEGAR